MFNRGPAGIGILWGAAGFGLIVGGALAHKLGPRLTFGGYKRTDRDLLPRSRRLVRALQPGGEFLCGACSGLVFRVAAVAVSSVLNWSLLLRHVDDAYRGRVFATNESLIWATMMLSMMAAGIASQSVDPARHRRRRPASSAR